LYSNVFRRLQAVEAVRRTVAQLV